jgi:SAM-dependent methyltransferase
MRSTPESSPIYHLKEDCMPDPLSFPRYLAAKRSVDDRALNRRVWDSLVFWLSCHAGQLSVLEIGAGIGTMFQRMVEWNGLSHAEYTAIDSLEENIHYAQSILPSWALTQKLELARKEDSLLFSAPDRSLDLRLRAVDLFDFLKQAPKDQHWDLLVANAFLDLVNVPETLPQLAGLLRPGGLLYLTINFDGLTILEPQIDPRLDEKIQQLFHQSMDKRRVAGKLSGDSRTGRRMFTWLRQAGLEILEAGSSDWVVYSREGGYPADEAYFLGFILHFFEDSLLDNPALRNEPFSEWLTARREQIGRGELVYLAHQMDFLVRVPG